MIHARDDYNRIQDPENKIGEDEPVFLVRAKDRFSIKAMQAWVDAALLEAGLGEKEDLELKRMAGKVQGHIAKTIEWQVKNGSKVPDL